MNNAVIPQDLLQEVAAISGTSDPVAFYGVLKNTVMPNNASDAQTTAFLMVAKEYNLNPLTKEIYAFPTGGGGIQPIVSIDGWLKIINSHPQFDGLETVENFDNNSNLISTTAKIYRKDRSKPVVITEYLSECRKNTEPWTKWTVRMLRHKATIQAARYAFGFSGIVDEDEAQRIAPRADDIQVEQAAFMSAEKIAEIESLIEETNSDLVKFLDHIKAKSIGQMAGGQYQNAVNLLTRKQEKAKSEVPAVSAEFTEAQQGEEIDLS